MNFPLLSKKIFLTVLLSLASNWSSSHSLLAQSTTSQEEQEKPPRIALVQPPTDDWDYALMGEFVGLISVGDNQFEPLGLQLRPLGPGHFEALQFLGGLPGHEGHQTAKVISLIGRRFEGAMVLSGGPWAIWIHKEHCVIFDSQGRNMGKLDRIQRGSSTMGARPPEGAVVLFDGTNTEQFVSGKMTEDGLLMAGADALPMFQDFHLHCEFRLPYMPNSDDQARGNSGCYIHSRYEIQILDSFAQLPKFNGAAALYRTKSPDLNMSFPPLVWQTYDISFTAPRWAAGGTKIRNARITVWHNGVKVQDNVEIPGKTGAGKDEEPSLLPIRFQDHRDPVVFRNIWVIDRGVTEGITFPVLSPTPEQLEAERQKAEQLEAERQEALQKDAEAKAAQAEPDADVSDAATTAAETQSQSETAVTPAPAEPQSDAE